MRGHRFPNPVDRRTDLESKPNLIFLSFAKREITVLIGLSLKENLVMPVKANWKYRPQILTYPWGKANDHPLFTPKSIVWISPEPECSNLSLRFWCSSYTNHLQDTGKPVFAIKFLSTCTKGCLQKLQEKRIKDFWLVFPSVFSSPYLCISNHQGATFLFSITEWLPMFLTMKAWIHPQESQGSI